MKKTFLILMLMALFAGCNQPQTIDDSDENGIHINEVLRTELLKILKLDQDLRLSLDTLENIYDWESKLVQQTWKQIHINDSINLIRVEAIIEEYGWPGKSLVGEDVADVAFLVLQHCGDVELMEKYLPVINEAVENDELDRPSLALYIDRIKMFKGEDQIYGTQLSYDETTQALSLYPVEDEKNLNARRLQMDLLPIEEYMEHFGLEYQIPE